MVQPGIAIAIDVDNLLISSATAGHDFRNYSLLAGFNSMFQWIETFAEPRCVYWYMPPSQSIKNDEIFHTLWERYKGKCIFEMIYCPKKHLEDVLSSADNVDQHLIDHTYALAPLLAGKIGYFCLASGDLDYSPLLWDLKRNHGLEMAFVIGSEASFSRVYRQTNLVGKHPHSNTELVHCFSPKEDS